MASAGQPNFRVVEMEDGSRWLYAGCVPDEDAAHWIEHAGFEVGAGPAAFVRCAEGLTGIAKKLGR